MEVIIFCDRETATTETYSASGNVVAVGLLLRQHSAIECRRRGREKNQFPPTLPRGGFRAVRQYLLIVTYRNIGRWYFEPILLLVICATNLSTYVVCSKI